MVNVLLHALDAALLLFWVLLRATGYMGRSFMVAALFALHPVNVESGSINLRTQDRAGDLTSPGGIRLVCPQAARGSLCRSRAAVCAGFHVQAAGHHLALRAAALGLLAVAEDVGTSGPEAAEFADPARGPPQKPFPG